jgi:hypothetical protein
MKDIIYSYLEKGKDGLDRDIRYIKEENLPYLIKELNELTTPNVLSNYFTSLDIGSQFEITKDNGSHGFEIGETVILEDIMSVDDDEYKFRGKKTYWWCRFDEVKKL